LLKLLLSASTILALVLMLYLFNLLLYGIWAYRIAPLDKYLYAAAVSLVLLLVVPFLYLAVRKRIKAMLRNTSTQQRSTREREEV